MDTFYSNDNDTADNHVDRNIIVGQYIFADNTILSSYFPDVPKRLDGFMSSADRFSFCRVLHTTFSHSRAHAFARSVTVARSSAVQASSSRRQERGWAIVCGSPQSQGCVDGFKTSAVRGEL